MLFLSSSIFSGDLSTSLFPSLVSLPSSLLSLSFQPPIGVAFPPRLAKHPRTLLFRDIDFYPYPSETPRAFYPYLVLSLSLSLSLCFSSCSTLPIESKDSTVFLQPSIDGVYSPRLEKHSRVSCSRPF